MSFEIEGIVKVIGEEQSFNEGSFLKKEHLLDVVDGAYTQTLPIDVSQKNIGLFDAVNVGDKVKVDVNLRSNEHNGKWYVSINGWRLAIVEKGTGIPDQADAPVASETPVEPDTASDDGGDDDLPF